jgi:large subunit ribosomal protein L4
MPVVDVFDLEKRKVGEVSLPDAVFAADVKPHLLHEVVMMQLANRRAGTHSTLGRSEVRGGGKKPWRQKGTGRARHGTIRSPLWRGGGIVFGPKPRDYSYSVPKKVKKAALRSALTARAQEGTITVLEHFDLPEVKTKGFVKVMRTFGLESALIVVDRDNETLRKSARNVPNVKVLRSEGLNVHDVLRHKALVLTRPTIEKIGSALGDQGREGRAASTAGDGTESRVPAADGGEQRAAAQNG